MTSDVLQAVHDCVVHFADRFLSTKPDYQLIIAGDMNKFDTQSLSLDLGLVDIVTKPTRQDNILDHILMSKDLANSYNLDRVIYDAPIASSDHLMITCVPDCRRTSACVTRWHKVFDFRQSNIDWLYEQANSIDWDAVLNAGSDVNEKWHMFHSCLMDLLYQCIPTRTVPITETDKDWMTPIAKMLIMDPWNAFRCGNWPKFVHLKSKVKEEISKCKSIWAEKLMNSTNGLWKLVKSHSRSRGDGLSSLVNKLGSVDKLIEHLTQKLVSHFAGCNASTALVSDDGEHIDWCPVFSVHEVWRQLRHYPKNKAPGSDGIPTRIYVELADIIAKLLSVIFNQSCHEGVFPDQWKNGVVVPIPKANPPELDKLRFITLLPVPSKIFETLVLNSLRSKFESAYGPEQHGFRRNGSSTAALLKIMDSAAKVYDDSSQFGAALLSFDLSSAFDCVNHDLAIQRMQVLGFPRGFLLWLSSYLHDRKGMLKIHTSLSEHFEIQKGVPQGSVLGPSIFCTYVSGYYSPFSHGVTDVKYADDFSLIIPLEEGSVELVQTAINRETDNFSEWCKALGLTINLSKSRCVLIARHELSLPHLTIEKVDSIRLLGIHLNQKLNWDCHIQFLRKRCSQRLHILRHLRGLICQNRLFQVYQSLVRSLMEFACPLFVGLNKKQHTTLQKLERRALKIIYCDSPIPDHESIHLRLMSLSCKLWHEIEKDDQHLLHHLIPVRLPHSKKYRVDAFRTNVLGNSFFPFMTRALNNMDTTDNTK